MKCFQILSCQPRVTVTSCFVYKVIRDLYSLDHVFISPILRIGLKTYAPISNAHLSHVCKRGKLSGSCLSTLNGFGSTQLPIFLRHIGVPTFSSQNN